MPVFEYELAAAHEHSESDEDDEEMVAASANDAAKGRPRIYKTEGLHERLEEFQWTDGAPWTETLIVTSEEPTAVPNVHDDLNRELAFYNQAMAAAKAGMLQLIEERCPFRRPDDYYAEMVKTDAHMAKVKGRLIEQVKHVEEGEQRRKQRELKRYGKQVQAEVLKQRAQDKKKSMADLTRWRKGQGSQGAGGLDDDGFDQQMAKRGRSPSVGRGGGGGGRGGGGGPNAKRQSKNEQYGFGGRKKVQKQNDAASAADMSGYKGNKGGGGGGGRGGRGGGRGGRGGGRGGASNRPGKERRKQMK